MLEGITVLSTTPESSGAMYKPIGIVCIFFILILVCAFVYFIYIKSLRDVVLSIVFILMFLALMNICFKEYKYPTTYKVTISDQVNFNEFNSRYEVLNVDGLIYTIKEKVN